MDWFLYDNGLHHKRVKFLIQLSHYIIYSLSLGWSNIVMFSYYVFSFDE